MINLFKKFIDNYIIWYLYDKPKDLYKTIRCWWYCDAKNPYHWRLVWFTLFYSRPWDSIYIWKLIELQIKKSNYYFTHNSLMISDMREKSVLKWQRIILNLLHIINNEHELWDWDFSTNTYKCLVNVNTRTAKRFAVRGTDYETGKIIPCYEYMINEPHELYLEKARRLVLRILNTYSHEWWD